jgi:hypothetical protein
MADNDASALVADGEPTAIVAPPPEWIRDDAAHFNLVRFSALRPYTPPSAVEEIVRAEVDGAHEKGGMFLPTMRPHVIGHHSRLPLLDRLVASRKAKPGVWFATHEGAARWCAAQAGLKPKGG